MIEENIMAITLRAVTVSNHNRFFGSRAGTPHSPARLRRDENFIQGWCSIGSHSSSPDPRTRLIAQQDLPAIVVIWRAWYSTFVVS